MVSVSSYHTLFILIVLLNIIDAMLYKEYKTKTYCDMIGKNSVDDHDKILGPWKIYYVWGLKMISCNDLLIERVSTKIKDRLATAFKANMKGNRDWFGTDLLMLSGSLELLLFVDGTSQGGVKALENMFLVALSGNKTIHLVDHALETRHAYKYLVLLNCEKLIGYLMARTTDTTVSETKIASLVKEVLPQRKGRFFCIPEKSHWSYNTTTQKENLVQPRKKNSRVTKVKGKNKEKANK